MILRGVTKMSFIGTLARVHHTKNACACAKTDLGKTFDGTRKGMCVILSSVLYSNDHVTQFICVASLKFGTFRLSGVVAVFERLARTTQSEIIDKRWDFVFGTRVINFFFTLINGGGGTFDEHYL